MSDITITSNGSGEEQWEAVISPEYGAGLLALSCGGKAILRSPKSRDEWKKNPYLYGNPLLLPPNRTRDGRFTFDGRSYSLPINEPEKNNHIHGQLFDAPYTVTGRTENKLSCTFQNHGERYPFPFTITFDYQISKQGLHIDIMVKNDGESPMPLILGFHMTFVEPRVFSVPIEKRWERDERFLPTGRLLPLNPEEEQIRTGCSFHGKPLTGYYTSGGNQIRVGDFAMETSKEFNQWVLYNGGGENYLCAEPQTGPVNGLNLPGGSRILRSGETERYWLRFMVYREQEKRT